ncbi:MAG: hypothetical protein ACTHOH_10515 [Lysobacteraceae bacterium]
MAVITAVLAIVVATVRVEATTVGKSGPGAESHDRERRGHNRDDDTVPGHLHSPCGIDRLRFCNAVRVCCALHGRVNGFGAFASNKAQGEYRSRCRKSLRQSVAMIVASKAIQELESPSPAFCGLERSR